METRANYILVGLFTLSVMVGAFAFVYWFRAQPGGPERRHYDVVFETPVSGLRPGSWVSFNGIRVGEVNTVRIDPDAPRQVVVGISVDGNVVLRTDTWVGLEFLGLTGFASVALRGGSADAPVLDPPILRADVTGTQDVSSAARSVLHRLDSLVSNNERAFGATLKNLETFSQTLADNSERIDRILGSAETVMNGADAKLEEIADAMRSVRKVADNLDKNVTEVSSGLTRFSKTGLRQWERLAVEGRRAISTLEQAVKNIDQNPSRLLFGGAPEQPAGHPGATGTVRR
ncbi:Mammalian cell entry related domain protein [Rhodovulum sp. PH10]|uniref:MlaD family protein n=1 Tax=Rhodovulum sp. PH10 TaxID=1187851 RepID=UPI00027C20D9|nr:MlaD family protein [Rhodovulum sp. PH10]EJW09620.1 Mammalian cell entry related domain protein [Rhodovulum sp. PH10]